MYYRLGLIGYPLERSLSPMLHQAALHAKGLLGEYKLYPVVPLPEGEVQLAEMIHRVRQGELQGLNVTIPHKQNVVQYLDELTPTARAVAAVNTIYMQQGRLLGDNTDIAGFWADLERSLPGLAGKALVLGAGGSARAVVYALLQHGWEVLVAARRLEQAAALLQALNAPGTARAIRLAAGELSDILELKLIVNTTPAGMHPKPDESPWPAETRLPEAAVYDLIYKPAETEFLRQARQAGRQARNGLGMLVEQARLSFERWTGISVESEAMWRAIPTSQR